MEHKGLWTLQGEVPDEETLLPFGKARIAREGSDVTLVSWSATVAVCEEAAAELEAKGISAEVIDLRTLWPWDTEAVCASVEKTGRLIIAHEAVTVGGFGAEVAATIGSACFSSLKHPVVRLGSPRVPISYAPPLEDAIRVTSGAIALAAEAATS